LPEGRNSSFLVSKETDLVGKPPRVLPPTKNEVASPQIISRVEQPEVLAVSNSAVIGITSKRPPIVRRPISGIRRINVQPKPDSRQEFCVIGTEPKLTRVDSTRPPRVDSKQPDKHIPPSMFRPLSVKQNGRKEESRTRFHEIKSEDEERKTFFRRLRQLNSAKQLSSR
jgi:hypothetical protein